MEKNKNKSKLLILSGISVLTLVLSACAGNANMFRGDPGHTAVYSESGPTSLDTLDWKYTASGKTYSSPLVTDGTIYLGSNDKHLYAINQQTGQMKWRFKTGGNIESTPATANGIAVLSILPAKMEICMRPTQLPVIESGVLMPVHLSTVRLQSMATVSFSAPCTASCLPLTEIPGRNTGDSRQMVKFILHQL